VETDAHARDSSVASQPWYHASNKMVSVKNIFEKHMKHKEESVFKLLILNTDGDGDGDFLI